VARRSCLSRREHSPAAAVDDYGYDWMGTDGVVNAIGVSPSPPSP